MDHQAAVTGRGREVKVEAEVAGSGVVCEERDGRVKEGGGGQLHFSLLSSAREKGNPEGENQVGGKRGNGDPPVPPT